MYKGTYDGNIDEIKFVATFNSNKDSFSDYLNKFDTPDKCWMIRVTSKQPSKLNGKKVFTRSDCYLAIIQDDISHLLQKYNYYLSEDIIKSEKIKHIKVSNSGISVKMTTSKHFQIFKMVPNSFNALLGPYELGAGASLFYKNNHELLKNVDLIHGWNSTIEEMNSYFSNFTCGDKAFYLNQNMCKSIKNYSCAKIKELIDNSLDLQKKIFNGIGLYDEPYTAHYFYNGDNITKLTTIPFCVTTGSGRSNGKYTIVLKP